MGELHETANSNVVLESKPTYSAALQKEPKPAKSVRKTVRFAAPALKTSEQPTFISHTTSLVSGSSASNLPHSHVQQGPSSHIADEPPLPTRLQTSFEAQDFPSNLTGLETVRAFLANALGT